MKKIYFVIAVLVTASLISCVQEKSFDDRIVGENEVAFVLQNYSTRSAESYIPVRKGITANLGKVGDVDLVLEETISELDSSMPETRGIPMFTENIGSIYHDEMVVHVSGLGDATYSCLDDALEYDHIKGQPAQGKGWRYSYHYSKSPWTDDSTPVGFFFRVPEDMYSHGVSAIAESGFNSNGKTTFSYTSPTTAEAQQDILFSHVSVSKKKHKENLPNGTPVKLYHALSGVKFAIKNPSDQIGSKKIQVTRITFIGLKNTGTCTVDPYATASDGAPVVYATWPDASSTSGTNEIYQDFGAGDLVEFNPTNNPNFGSSFFDPATETNPGSDKQNINSQDASKTFWLIPQAFTSASTAKIRINFEYDSDGDGNAEPDVMVIELKDILAGVEWKAAQLRTYTFKINEVNVKIVDEMDIKGNAANSFTESEKKDVHITNSGDTDAFIRAAIVGQWRNLAEQPVFGFTDGVTHYEAVASWYNDQFVQKTPGSHGVFTDLAGYKTTSNPLKGWYLCEDGYYYYSNPVPPGKVTGTVISGEYTEQKLFTSYKILTAPHVTLSGVNTAIHFSLEISTQAIPANKSDGSHYGWQEAWERATGTRPTYIQTN